jgi:hypothetical protein
LRVQFRNSEVACDYQPIHGCHSCRDFSLAREAAREMAHIVRTLLVSGAAVGLMAGAGGCSFSTGSSSAHAVSKEDVVQQITAKMTDAQGNKPESVTCPGDSRRRSARN